MINGFSTLMYHSIFDNKRKDIWDLDNLFVLPWKNEKEKLLEKEAKKKIIKDYLDYLDKEYNIFSHKRYYLYVENEIKSLYHYYNYKLI